MEILTKVVIIEDNKIFREALTLLINSSNHYEVVNAYKSCEEALVEIDKDAPSTVIMDINLPGIDGIEGTKIIKKKIPDTNVLVISEAGNKESIFKAFAAGAVGFLTKDESYIALLEAIKEVGEGGAPMSKKVSRSLVESFHCNFDSPLSERETEVLQLLFKGKTYKEIAEYLFVHPETIKSHLKNIYIKLNVHNKTDAIRKALDQKFLSL